MYGRIPKNLQTDDGKDFFNKDFKNLMSKYSINHYFIYSRMKSSIIESFNRTFKSLMFREFHLMVHMSGLIFIIN